MLCAFRCTSSWFACALIRARHLLFEGELSIENVVYQSGFPSLSQFYVQFSRAYGVTPRQMRAHYLR